jgi:hypothetical protein
VNPGKVIIADMAAVFAQVDGDAVTAACRDDLCRPNRIGMIATARVANGRNVIDVHTQSQALRYHGFARLPGLIAGVAASSGGSSSGA